MCDSQMSVVLAMPEIVCAAELCSEPAYQVLRGYAAATLPAHARARHAHARVCHALAHLAHPVAAPESPISGCAWVCMT